MATCYILWSEQDRDTYPVGGGTQVFPSSAAASTFLANSAGFREDVHPRRATTARTWDVVSVTVA
jgi:hypothetical protein